MLQNAYFLAKIGGDTAENEQHFAEFLPKTGNDGERADRVVPPVAVGLGRVGWPARKAQRAKRYGVANLCFFLNVSKLEK